MFLKVNIFLSTGKSTFSPRIVCGRNTVCTELCCKQILNAVDLLITMAVAGARFSKPGQREVRDWTSRVLYQDAVLSRKHEKDLGRQPDSPGQDAHLEGKMTGISQCSKCLKKQGTVVQLGPSSIFYSHGQLLRLLHTFMNGGKKAIPNSSVKYVNPVGMYLVKRSPAHCQLQRGYSQQLLTFTSGQLFFFTAFTFFSP